MTNSCYSRLACLASLLSVGLAAPLSGQNPLEQLQPYTHLERAYVTLDRLDYAFGTALGQVDSVLSVQTDIPADTNRYLVQFTPDSLVLDFLFPSGTQGSQREIFRIALRGDNAASDVVVHSNTIRMPSFSFDGLERSVRYFKDDHLDSIRTEIFPAQNLDAGTRLVRRSYASGQTSEVVLERTESGGDLFLTLDSTVVRYEAQGPKVLDGASFSYDYDEEDYAATTIYTYDYTDPRGRRLKFDARPGAAAAELQFVETSELSSIETRPAGASQSESILVRLDDGSNSFIRKYLRNSGFANIFFEDTWFYGKILLSARELPLVAGQVAGANPIVAGDELRLSGFADKALMQLIDGSGRIIEMRTFSGSEVFAWPSVPPGAYYLVVSTPGFTTRAWPWVNY